MIPSTTPSTAATAPVDEDLAEQARPGYGIPSQDPRTGAQTALEPEDAEREAHSALMGGGVMAGAAAGAAVGVAVAGPVGVVEARRDIRAAGSAINAWGLLFHAAKGNCTV